jgi:hypothetical protein
MTSSAARSAANAVLATAGLAAAYVVITSPPLRRLALRGMQVWLGATLPAYLMTEARRAWVASGHSPRLGSTQAA